MSSGPTLHPRTTLLRNIAFVGQSGAGKTTLTEALLFRSGTISDKGDVARGTTVSDHTAAEKRIGHSLDTSVCHVQSHGVDITILDTPGFPGFAGRSETVLPAVETVGVVIDAKSGIHPTTRRMMRAAKADRCCRMIIVNKIDTAVDLGGLMGRLQERFGTGCMPINLPTADGASVVDCYFQAAGAPTAFSSVEEAHTNLIERVVEEDDELMELYLEQGEDLEPAQLHGPFEKALRRGHLIPVCFTSAENGVGLDELLQFFEKLLPHPGEGNHPPYMKGEGDQAVPVDVAPDPDGHVIAHVFKVFHDTYRGKVGVFRVHQGTIEQGAQLLVGDAKKPIKVAHLYRLQGADAVEVERGVPGDILSIAKVDEIHFDAVLHDSHDEDHFHLQSFALPTPLYGRALTPRRRSDEQKLAESLSKLAAEDPCVQIEHVRETHETVLYGLSQTHLRTVLERLSEDLNVEVDTHEPTVAYRETIRKSATARYRHKKQTGGAGQFGEVELTVAPLGRGAGFSFVSKIKGGVIPGPLIPAVERGVREAMAEGVLAGFPMQDIEVTLLDGKYHAVDSKEVAFIAAGKKAFKQAVAEAGLVLLEPIVELHVHAPATAMGDLTRDLASRRGHVLGMNHESDGTAILDGQVPLAEVTEYGTTLRSITGGGDMYTLDFSHHAELPPDKQAQLVGERART